MFEQSGIGRPEPALIATTYVDRIRARLKPTPGNRERHFFIGQPDCYHQLHIPQKIGDIAHNADVVWHDPSVRYRYGINLKLTS